MSLSQNSNKSTRSLVSRHLRTACINKSSSSADIDRLILDKKANGNSGHHFKSSSLNSRADFYKAGALSSSSSSCASSSKENIPPSQDSTNTTLTSTVTVTNSASASSIAQEHTLVDESDADNELDASHFDAVFGAGDHADRLTLEYKSSRLENERVATLIKCVECFNTDVRDSLAATYLDTYGYELVPLKLGLLARSLLSNSSHAKAYWLATLDTLIKLVLVQRSPALANAHLFNVTLRQLLEASETASTTTSPITATTTTTTKVTLSTIDKCFVLLKTADALHTTTTTTTTSEIGHVLLADYESSELERALNRAECVSELEVASKLQLLAFLLDLVLVVMGAYRERLDAADAEIGELESQLDRYKSDRDEFVLRNEIYDDISSSYLGGSGGESSQASYALNLDQLIEKLDGELKRKEAEQRAMARHLEPFGSVTLRGKNESVNLWHVGCLASCLLIERVVYNDDDDEHAAASTSEWHLVSERERLDALLDAFNTHLIDSSLVNGMLNILRHKEDNDAFAERAAKYNNAAAGLKLLHMRLTAKYTLDTVYRDESSSSSSSHHHYQQFDLNNNNCMQPKSTNCVVSRSLSTNQVNIFIYYLSDVKKRLLLSNFVAYDVTTDAESGSLTAFTIHPAFVEFEQIRARIETSDSSTKVTLLPSLVEAIYQLIECKYLHSQFNKASVRQSWLELVRRAHSLRRVRFLFGLLEANVRWPLSMTAAADDDCHICRLKDGILKQNDPFYSQRSILVKYQCDACYKCIYHIGCLLAFKNVRAADLSAYGERANERHDLVEQRNVRNGRGARSLFCYACDQKAKRDQLKSKIEKDDQKKLNAIEVSNHTLRLNRARIEKRWDTVLKENNDADREPVPKIKIIKGNLATDDMGSDDDQDQDYLPSKKRRKVDTTAAAAAVAVAVATHQPTESELEFRKKLRPRTTINKYTFN